MRFTTYSKYKGRWLDALNLDRDSLEVRAKSEDLAIIAAEYAKAVVPNLVDSYR